MTDIDSGQLLTAGTQFRQHLLGLGFAELGIDQNGVVLAADNHRTDRKQGFGTRVVDIQLQRLLGGLRLGQDTESGNGQQQTAQGERTTHQGNSCEGGNEQQLSCTNQCKKCDAGT
ncbi:hypothetical protein D3C79_954020 [compost metagenome]